jgi:hypothetical protein
MRVGSIDEVSAATTTIDAPLSDAVIVAVSRLVDDHGQRRDPSHSDITFQIKRVGLEDGDLTTPAGKGEARSGGPELCTRVRPTCWPTPRATTHLNSQSQRWLPS